MEVRYYKNGFEIINKDRGSTKFVPYSRVDDFDYSIDGKGSLFVIHTAQNQNLTFGFKDGMSACNAYYEFLQKYNEWDGR